MYRPKSEKDIRSQLELGIYVFGGKWRTRIICLLAKNTMLRYGSLRKSLEGITDTVLASNLKLLISHEIVERRQIDTIPPQTEYRLTQRGYDLVPILQQICRWTDVTFGKDVQLWSVCQNCPDSGDCCHAGKESEGE